MVAMVVMAGARAYSSVVLLLQLITITETGALSQHSMHHISVGLVQRRLIHPV
jgi:hypothetical protein